MRGLPALVLLAVACASVPGAPAPGRSGAWGMLRLVPREGVTPGGSGGGAYGDRRLRDVAYVDYSKPGFAVVYVEAEAAPAGELELIIREHRVGARFEPEHGAVGAAGRIVVHNDTGVKHVLSYPAAGSVQQLEPGARVVLDVPRAGEQGLFLLDVPAGEARIFASPGPYDVVSADGRYALPDVAPGRREIRAWHPRFPPAMTAVVLPPDEPVEVDLEMGVGRADSHSGSHSDGDSDGDSEADGSAGHAH